MHVKMKGMGMYIHVRALEIGRYEFNLVIIVYGVFI